MPESGEGELADVKDELVVDGYTYNAMDIFYATLQDQVWRMREEWIVSVACLDVAREALDVATKREVLERGRVLSVAKWLGEFERGDGVDFEGWCEQLGIEMSGAQAAGQEEAGDGD